MRNFKVPEFLRIVSAMRVTTNKPSLKVDFSQCRLGSPLTSVASEVIMEEQRVNWRLWRGCLQVRLGSGSHHSSLGGTPAQPSSRGGRKGSGRETRGTNSHSLGASTCAVTHVPASTLVE